MGKIIPVLILIFYFLALFQASFMAHFNILGVVPNLILLAVFLINLFEKPEAKAGIAAAFLGGFFMDIFSGRFIGFYILISLLICVFVKYVLRKNISVPSFG